MLRYWTTDPWLLLSEHAVKEDSWWDVNIHKTALQLSQTPRHADRSHQQSFMYADLLNKTEAYTNWVAINN